MAVESHVEHTPTIRIDYFTIADHGFSCSVLSRADIVEQMRENLMRYFSELGFTVVEGDADYQIVGEFHTLDQGSRLARATFPVIAGAAVVRTSVEIKHRDKTVGEFELHNRKGAGFWGGDSRQLLTLAIDQLAMRIASDAGVATGTATGEASAGATRYLITMTIVAVLVSVALAWLAHQYAITIPERRDGMTAAEKPWWAVFIGVMSLFDFILIGLVVAPGRVLACRQLLWLRSFSGVSTVLALRLVLLLLCLPALGLMLLSCVAL